LTWLDFIRGLGIVAALAGLACGLLDWWVDAAALLLLVVACGLVLMLANMGE